MKNKGLPAEKPGYTLIELMIVLTIIVIFASIAMASMVRQQDQQLFNNQFESVLSMINNARSMAITGKGQLDYTDFDHDGCTDKDVASGATCTAPDYVTPANYGVHFDSAVSAGTENVVLFADVNPPAANADKKGAYNSGENYNLGDDLKLGNIVNLGTNFCLKIWDSRKEINLSNQGSIFFSPNYADINFENFIVNDDIPFLKISLHDNTAANRCKQITIHKLAGIPEVTQCDTDLASLSCTTSP